MMLYQLLLLGCLVSISLGADQAALVTNLPGLINKPTFRQYSGYLQASTTNRLHYWFVESQSNPATDPVVLWLNGGPGCSSLDGFLSENGPFRIQDNLTLVDNPNAWNKEANVLYLESPAGVGFSVATDGNVTTDDNKVARENHNALVDFFTKFPEYKSNEFFVTGESYGGVYIPTLTVLLLSDERFKLKGIAVGNGLSSYRYNDVSLLYFMYYHGLFGQDTWNSLLKNCNCTGKTRCFFEDDKSSKCSIAVYQASSAINGLNIYNLYGPCYNPNSVDNSGLTVSHDFGILFRSNPLISWKRKLFNSALLKMSQNGSRVTLNPNCVNGTAATMYLNIPSVRAALHIPDSVQQWELCSAAVGARYHRNYQEMSAQYRQIMESNKIRVLIYNGDVDMACNFLGDEWFFDDLKYPLDYARRQWFVYNSYGKQVGGVSKSFANGKLVFTTVRGAGHMVPTDRPVPAFHMISTFLRGQHL